MSKLIHGLIVLAGSILLTTSANAAFVTFSDFDDNDGAALGYDPIATAAGATGNSNTLDFVLNDFEAVASVGDAAVYNDQISFTITAAPGEIITSFSFTEDLMTMLDANSFVGYSLNIDVNGESFDLGSDVRTGGNTGGTETITVSNSLIDFADAAVVMVSIDNNLFAANGAEIVKSMSSITVSTQPIPLPPAAWLFGSALAGFTMIGRRKQA